MENKSKKATILVISLLALLVLVFGTSYAYFTTRINSVGEGAKAEAQTATKGDTTVTTTGTMEFTDTNIYPGHQNISSIKVTATGDKNILYNLIWEGTNTLNTTLKYTIYKTTEEQTPSITCAKKEEGKITKKLYEECTKSGFENLESLESIVASGEIAASTESTKIKLIKNETLQATNDGANVYYYVVLEYPNNDESQNIDMNGRFSGTVKTELLEKEDVTAAEVILAGKTIDESRANGITGILEENTTGKIFKAVDDDGDTYFFAGAVDNNWVQFGGFYWRIIRINGDGTIRMIYSGVANGNVSDANKIGTTTQISNDDGTTTDYAYNTNYNDNAYVGYMYGQVGAENYADTHKNTTSSYAKQQVDTWYNANLNKEGLKEYIDTNAGFCGDRSLNTSSETWASWDTKKGYGVHATTYGPYGRAMLEAAERIIQYPAFKCSQNNDWYTVSGASKGNKALQYPVGLITADEAVYAGGFGETNNTSYYLYTEESYWTISPYNVYTRRDANVFVVSSNGYFINMRVNNTHNGIRPVINLKADTQLTGDGTETNPYKVA